MLSPLNPPLLRDLCALLLPFGGVNRLNLSG